MSGHSPEVKLERFLDLRERILQSPPERVMMAAWSSEGEKLQLSQCGTSYCIGGFAATLAPIEIVNKYERNIPKIAQAWLFGEGNFERESLYFTHEWPYRYRCRYNQSVTNEQAKSAVLSYLTYRIDLLRRQVNRKIKRNNHEIR